MSNQMGLHVKPFSPCRLYPLMYIPINTNGSKDKKGKMGYIFVILNLNIIIKE